MNAGGMALDADGDDVAKIWKAGPQVSTDPVIVSPMGMGDIIMAMPIVKYTYLLQGYKARESPRGGSKGSECGKTVK